MAILYKTSKHALIIDEPSLTEQEHKDSCDINLMLKSAARGQAFRTSRPGQYGYEDLNQTQLQMRITKEEIENDFAKNPKDQFTEEELKKIPLALIQKFGLKPKQKREKSKNAKNASEQPENQEPTSPPTPASNDAPKAD